MHTCTLHVWSTLVAIYLWSNDRWTCTGQYIFQKKKCWQHPNFHFKSPPLVNTQHGKFVLWQIIMAKKICWATLRAAQLERLFCFLTKNYGHLPLPSYKIFIPDEADLVNGCQRQANQNHSANFPQTRWAKLQHLSMKRRSRAASFCPSEQKSWHFSTGYYFKKKPGCPLQMIMQKWWQPWSAVVKVMTLLLPFNQWEFSISKETGNSLFSKEVYSSSIFLSLHPVTSSILSWHPVLLQLPPHVQWSNKNTRKWRAVNSLGIAWRTNHI